MRSLVEIITQDPQEALDNVHRDLPDATNLALGNPTKKNVNRYEDLRAQLRQHRDGTRGHLERWRKAVVHVPRFYQRFGAPETIVFNSKIRQAWKPKRG